jgi:hypothetical protein
MGFIPVMSFSSTQRRAQQARIWKSDAKSKPEPFRQAECVFAPAECDISV